MKLFTDSSCSSFTAASFAINSSKVGDLSCVFLLMVEPLWHLAPAVSVVVVVLILFVTVAPAVVAVVVAGIVADVLTCFSNSWCKC